MRALLLTLVSCCLVAVEVAADPPAGDTPPTGNRYSLHSSGEHTLLLDRQTGETWILRTNPEVAQWQPIPRKQSDESVAASRPSENDEQQAASDLSELLLQLLIDERALAAKYGPEHPRVLGARTRIELTRKLLQEEKTLLEKYAPGHPRVLAHQKRIALFRQYLQEKGSGDSTSAELIPLLLEVQTLLESYGPGHPKLQEIRTAIEAPRQLIQSQPQFESDLDKRLASLLVEEQLLLLQYGSEHPNVVRVRKEIELTRSFRKDAAQPKPAE